MTKIACAKSPCVSCPYRRDVPSGLWGKEEYDKLPVYDLSIIGQILGKAGIFMCHQQDGKVCAGWIGCHGAGNLALMRLAHAFQPDDVDPDIWDYKSPVPLFQSGAQASIHGIKAINRPGVRAKRMVAQLVRKRGRKEAAK